MQTQTGLRSRSPEAGFYQVEILVGMTILMLVVAIVASYYKYNVKATKKSDSFYVSTKLAAAALEDAKGDMSNPDTLKAILDKVADTTWTRKSKVTQQGKAYDVKVRFRKVSSTSNLMRIKAYVNWDGARGSTMGTVHPYVP